MLKFVKLGADAKKLKNYFDSSEISFCDISVGVKYMWRDEYVIDYAIADGGSLVMLETGPGYKSFYYPMGGDVEEALGEIESYCRENALPLVFGCIDDRVAGLLSKRYYDVETTFERDWSDYVYDAEEFKTYRGKKLDGQRNHVNKFKKTYPDYKVSVMTEEDVPRIKEFLSDYEGENVFSASAKDEESKVFDYVSHFRELGQSGAFIETGGKIVAVSVGEVVGDTLIVHIEKALVEYAGAYPMMASEFAKAFATDGVKYINREEDCGEEGLRISKTRYKPIEIKNKNTVAVFTVFDRIKEPISIKTERLTVSDIERGDAERYAELSLDDDLNRFYGYDYREDLKDNPPTPDYFFAFQQSLKDGKEEYPLAVRKDGEMIGEVILHSFDYFGGAEMGFRFFREFQGMGYAYEAARAVADYFFSSLNGKTLKAKCFKENLSSAKLIGKLGFAPAGEDEKYFYFKICR